ncbi:glucose-6-phosphate dehydrogenase (coenzyme-F420) [Pseudactinotalea sp. HY160]|uniref:glucose-6-phosphate dehydrogenase (coenzyme-F420) n=1 Tax=Pseudactinotalea sp. HY160 TaxID=2654490 RepID=UPI00128D4401|nr:glucose-6-phosphate dehydrogenase (coenzyme-F420) [Pseudactinotalea sp. HY160]MPV49407.1 glucose-6-phosphate dehydrogenase (coenzyme-F420) [Pseudactinotalea sp. HY160]
MTRIRFGYKASAEQFSPADLLQFAVAAERAGFDSVFTSDHLQPWRHHGGHAPAALPWLGALAASTSAVHIGTSVLTPTLRYHPAVIAQAFATLGLLAPGRVILGLGTGESMNEAPLGRAWPSGRERLDRLREAVELIRALWDRERVTFEGEYYRTDRATVYDRPEVPVPIYLAASGPRATRSAGELGDGFITTSGKGAGLYTGTLLPALAEGAAAAGRSAADLDLMMEVKVSFDPDLSHAREATRYWGALALSPEEKTGVSDPVEMERLADALPTERTVTRWIVSNDPEHLAEQIWSYVDMGFTHLVFHDPDPDQHRFLDAFGSRVLPLLHARAGR